MGYGKDGVMTSLIVDDVYIRSIATADYDPAADTTDLNAAQIGALLTNGFYVKPNLDGDLYVITLRQYKNNKNSITGLTPINIGPAVAGFYEPVPVVLVKATNDGTYPSTATSICVGTIMC